MTKEAEVIEEEKTLDDFWDEAVAEDDDDFVAPTDKDEEEEVKEEEEVTAEEEVVDEPQKTESEMLTAAQEQLAASEAENEKLTHKMSSWEGRIKKANERATAAEDMLTDLEKKKPVDAAADDLVSTDDDDDKDLTDFKEEFPDLVKPMIALAKKYAKATADERLGEVTPTLEKIQVSQELSEKERFLAPITAAHPDWKTIHESGKLKEWIDTKPSLEQRVYNEVVANGSQKELIGMFDVYKKEKNISVQQEPDKSGEVDPALKDIVAVPGKPGNLPGDKPDKDDFDAAWEEANRQK